MVVSVSEAKLAWFSSYFPPVSSKFDVALWISVPEACLFLKVPQ